MWLVKVNARHNIRILYSRICGTYIPCVAFLRNVRQHHNYNNVLRHRRGSLYILGTWWHLIASCRSLPESSNICWDHAHVVFLLLLGHVHTVASSTSLCCSNSCILHLLFLLHMACFLLIQPQAAMIRSTAGTPTTSVQPAPETSTPLASAGCPQVRLARFTLQNQLLVTPIRAYFHRT